jgi:8-amino-7-oxononanoate synthase
METEIEKKIIETLKIVREKELYPDIKIIEGGISSEPEFVVKGRKMLSFCSSNCLGLANNKKIKNAIIEGFRRYGISPVAPYLTCGTLQIHKRLEREIANFIGMEDAMIFNTSTMGNMGVIPALINLPVTTFFSFLKIPFKKIEEAVLFSDELNHGTVIEGCRLAKAERIVYKHRDMNDLENKLKKYRKFKRKLILSDGVFSMDGDIAPLRDIVALAQKYGAMVYVDDAAATGILGENGRGTMEYFGLKEGVDVIVTTFSKTIGLIGGTACASKEIIDYLRITAKTHMLSVAFPGALALGVLKALEIIKKDKTRRIKLWENTKYLKTKLQEAGFNTLNSQTPIIPILIGDEKIAINISRDLFDRGIFSPPIRWPAVPRGKARMRFIVSSEHSKEQMDRLVESLIDLGKKYKILK